MVNLGELFGKFALKRMLIMGMTAGNTSPKKRYQPGEVSSFWGASRRVAVFLLSFSEGMTTREARTETSTTLRFGAE
jgi:hypothetical protein